MNSGRKIYHFCSVLPNSSNFFKTVFFFTLTGLKYVRMAGELESDSIALERIRESEDLPQEDSWDTPGGGLPNVGFKSIYEI